MGLKDEGYFHRRTTHDHIKKLASPRDWTIYLGAGVTVDRTGLTWRSLVDQLWAQFETNDSTRAVVLDRFGEIRTASIVQEHYRERNLTDARLIEDIRGLLYGGHRHMRGRLLEYIVDFSIRMALADKSVVLVTPNYDDYLISELIKHRLARVKEKKEAPPIVFAVANRTSSNEIELIDQISPGTITCVYVHGFVPRPDFPDEELAAKEAPPVFS